MVEPERYDFAVLGAGALGTIIGAHLARAGQRVVMLARGARAKEISVNGLRIEGLAQFVQPVAVQADPSRFGGADVLIVATKTYGTAAALAPLRHADINTVFSVQNGLLKDEQLAAVWGPVRVLGALANTSGELRADGSVLYTRNELMCLGALAGGNAANAARIARTIDAAGVRTEAVTNIESLEWSKFAAWTGLMVVAVMTRAASVDFLAEPSSARLVARLVREVGQLALARGIALSDHSTLPVATLCAIDEEAATVVVQAFGSELRTRAPLHRMSALQDLEARRPLEVEETLGHAVRLAQAMPLKLPLLEASYALVTAIDRTGRAVLGRAP